MIDAGVQNALLMKVSLEHLLIDWFGTLFIMKDVEFTARPFAPVAENAGAHNPTSIG